MSVDYNQAPSRRTNTENQNSQLAEGDAPTEVISHHIDPLVLDSSTESIDAHRAPEVPDAHDSIGSQLGETAARSINGSESFGGRITTLMGGHKIAAAAGMIGIGVTTVFGANAAHNFIGNDRVSAVAPANQNDLGHDIQSDTVISAESLRGDRNGDGVVTSDEYDLMDPMEFKDLPDRTRVADVASKLHTHMPAAFDILWQDAGPEERKVLSMPDLDKPRAQWSDQDYVNYYSIGLELVSTQGDKKSQIDEGRRAMTVVMGNRHSDLISTMNNIGTAGGIRNVFAAQPSEFSGKELIAGTEIDDYRITGEGGRIVIADFLSQEDGPQTLAMLFVNRSDDNGNIVSMLAETFTPDDHRLVGIFDNK